MHRAGIRQQIIDRIIARLHGFDRLEPAKTALVTVDMQSTSSRRPGQICEVQLL
jgi:hypothetical protein